MSFICIIFDKFCFLLSSARIDPKNLVDSTIVKESVVLSEKVPETLVSKALKKVGLDESSPSEVYKYSSSNPALISRQFLRRRLKPIQALSRLLP